jgi:regulator of sirC expression with transglutaminase-like and TPR domain
LRCERKAGKVQAGTVWQQTDFSARMGKGVGLTPRSTLIAQLGSVGALDDAEIDLAETALLLAAVDHPDTDLDSYRRHLRDVAEAARTATSRAAGVDLQLAALRDVLVAERRYQGDADTYDDMDNANLIRVIDRRRGLPVALGILYLHAGRAFGADIVGLNFPSHFLVRLASRGQRVIIDPFHEARALAPEDLRQRLKELRGGDAEIEPDHYAPISNRDVLLRLQNNIKLRAVAAGEVARALDILETMRAISPGRSDLWWETAVLQSRLGHLTTAISTLQDFLSDFDGAPGQDEIEDLLRRLRARVN